MHKKIDRVTTLELKAMKARGEKIVMLTAYDSLFASLEDEAGIDVVLVGDSAGMVIAGYETTVPVEMEHMLYHTRCVSRGVKRAMVIADMPFMSFQVSPEQAVANAGRFLKEGRAQGVKIEGGVEIAETVRKISSAGIPVVGHIGLTPQSIHRFGGYIVRGTDHEEAEALMRDAAALEEAGAFMVVLEKITGAAAKGITETMKIPTIGCGAGPYCDGQVVVLHDMLGLFEKFKPKFVRRYLELAVEVRGAFQRYRDDIKNGRFPDEKETY